MKNMIKVFVMVGVAVSFLFYCNLLPQDYDTRLPSQLDQYPPCEFNMCEVEGKDGKCIVEGFTRPCKLDNGVIVKQEDFTGPG